MANGPLNVRDALRRVAEEVEPSPALPAVVRGRVRRRQAGMALVSAVVLAGVSVGAMVGIRALGTRASPAPINRTSLPPGPATPVACLPGWHISSGELLPGRVGQPFAVAAVSSADVWAVGDSFASADSNDSQPLMEHFDGTSWRAIPGPSMPGGRLVAAAAISSDDVWAVGNVQLIQPLIEHWDGSSWTVVPGAKIAPSEPPDIERQLLAVEAIASDDVWVLGQYSPTVGGESLSRDVFEHWDGKSWTVLPSAYDVSGTGMIAMQDLSAVATDNVWAVGGRVRGSSEAGSADGALIEHWDGKAWTRVVPPGGKAPLTTVAAVSRSDVWAARGGDFNTAQGTYGFGSASLLHWDGRTWKEVLAIPGSVTWPSAITSITAVAPNDVWAVGTRGKWGNLPFILHWNGSRWSEVASLGPQAIPRSSYTRMKVDHTRDGTVVAFGSELNGTPQNRIWFRCP